MEMSSAKWPAKEVQYPYSKKNTRDFSLFGEKLRQRLEIGQGGNVACGTFAEASIRLVRKTSVGISLSVILVNRASKTDRDSQ